MNRKTNSSNWTQLVKTGLIEDISTQTIAERQAFLGALFDDGYLMLPGGDMFFLTLKECKTAYVMGNFVSAILTSQQCLVYILSGFLHMKEIQEETGDPIKAICKTAKEEGIITRRECTIIQNLRKNLNPYIHMKDPKNEDNILTQRTNQTSATPNLAEDARLSLELLASFMKRQPLYFPTT